jgi:ATP synthase protein I
VSAKKRVLKKAGTWANLSIIGIQFPVAIVIGYFWGKWMDEWFGTSPWLTIVFSLFGIAAGFVNLFRITARAAREMDAEAAAQRDAQSSERADEDPHGGS